jgi:hypothetical protein
MEVRIERDKRVVISTPDAAFERKGSELHIDEIVSDYKNSHNFLMEEQKQEELPAPLPLLSMPDRDLTCPVRTGTSLPMMRQMPEFIEDIEPYEPISEPRENILETSLRREADRIENQESLLNRLVYDCIDPGPNSPPADSPAGELTPYYVPSSEDDHTLIFESRFESGNLRRAVQVYDFEYDLILKPDYNTKGNTQWFFFSIGNTRAGKLYRFNIINMMKPDSLYNYGMKPLMYSQTDAHRYRRGWVRCGTDVCYYQNSMRRKLGGFYYTLTFAVTFNYDYDVVYFAHCYPYTYSMLNTYLARLQADPKKRNRLRVKPLCQTIAGNNVDLITITSYLSPPEAITHRKGVVIMSRVHPGETNASWMMKGFIDYLTGPTLDAKILRDNFVFKIIPMLNPDGVINGSYRCGLAGVDLNRCWQDPNRKLHPTIFHAKQMVRQFCEDRNVVLSVDLHGHSRKKNIFMYGCIGKTRFRERVFPLLLEKTAEVFNFSDCVFGVQKAKESTARIVMYKELGLINSYTLEASFCGASFGKHADFHFNTEHLQEIAYNFCDALLDFCDPDQSRVKQIIEELEVMFPIKTTHEDSDEGSADSDYSGDEAPVKKKVVPKKVVKKKPTLTRKKGKEPAKIR